MDPVKLKALKHNAASEQALNGCLRDGDIIELELLQTREKKGRGSINLGETATANSGNAQCGCEAERGRRQRARWPGAPTLTGENELELLEAIKGGRPEPTVEHGIEAAEVADAVNIAEGETASRTRVCGEELGDNGDAVAHLPGKAVVNDEVEGGGAPEMAPP
jgi:hypothetical protein